MISCFICFCVCIQYDCDGDGKLNANEVKTILKHSKSEISEKTHSKYNHDIFYPDATDFREMRIKMENINNLLRELIEKDK